MFELIRNQRSYLTFSDTYLDIIYYI